LRSSCVPKQLVSSPNCTMTHAKFVALVFLLASAVAQASHCPRDGECPKDSKPQNGVSLLQTRLQTNVTEDSAEDVKTLMQVEVEESDARQASQKHDGNVLLKIKMNQAGGLAFSIDISLHETVEGMKGWVFFAAGVPVKYIKLVSAGRTWEDRSIVGSYEPHDGTVVEASRVGSSELFSAAPEGHHHHHDHHDAAAPEMFVAVFTTRSASAAKRETIRKLWSEVDAGSGNICARFIICNASDPYQQSLLAEQAAHGDFLFLDCAEGYAQGLLTKKLIQVLREYRDADDANDACLNRPLFKKVDDDTFVAGRSFREGFSRTVAQYGSDFLFAGVDSGGSPKHLPQRTVSDKWYEPWSVYPNHTYPLGMYGGPGYTLGRGLVRRIIDEKIADSNILWNEDRAVAVWVDILKKKGAPVSWVQIPGNNGYHKIVNSGTWGTYPYTLHHRVSKTTISCLTELEHTNNDSALIDPCFLQNTL